MSRTNKHRINWDPCPSLEYLRSLYPERKCCPRRSCKGTLVDVLARYYDLGPINYEKECTICGKVVKDPRFKEEREKRWKAREAKKARRDSQRRQKNEN